MVTKLRDIRIKTGMSVSTGSKIWYNSQTNTNIELHGQEPGIKLALQNCHLNNQQALE
ncbi:hypothetical protein [Lysinibacillus fusiformis]|uniref:hypothetical protein n=1 Tax=Lysinibacillus fusiformis TaxID=28031 RepID=UPI00263B330F|nr:hypothetical protein [Lysinibacillus fusiformis]MDC6266975.1 hypothetical protein [Lysinibacillus sphaericus]MDN4968765.1 hypothetical protein [Lysinibacillus fusiformis]